MRAIVIVEKQGKRALEFRDDVPVPEPGPEQILVRVRATSLNRADLARAASHYGAAGAAALPVAGLEFAGEVVAVGQGVTAWKAGDRVMSMGPGGYAEYAVANAGVAMPVPDGFTWEQAAACPVVFLTAHDAVVTNGALEPGGAILVNAASSGAGLAALQIARAKGAGTVIASSTSPEKLEALRDHGATVLLDAARPDFVAAVRDATGGRGVDVIVDHVGGPVIGQNVDAAAILGRIVSVGRLGGMRGEINLDELARKRLRLIGVTFRTRTVEEHVEIVRRFLDDLYPGFADGRLQPVIQRSFPLEEADQAQAYMRANRHLGKIVLTVA